MDWMEAERGSPAAAVFTSNKGVPSVSLMTLVKACSHASLKPGASWGVRPDGSGDNSGAMCKRYYAAIHWNAQIKLSSGYDHTPLEPIPVSSQGLLALPRIMPCL